MNENKKNDTKAVNLVDLGEGLVEQLDQLLLVRHRGSNRKRLDVRSNTFFSCQDHNITIL